jgi:hypothetical protein
MENQTLTERLDRAAGRLCGGYYEPKTDQEGADGALMLEAKDRIKVLEDSYESLLNVLNRARQSL